MKEKSTKMTALDNRKPPQPAHAQWKLQIHSISSVRRIHAFLQLSNQEDRGALQQDQSCIVHLFSSN